jgi:hypothetical protein
MRLADDRRDWSRFDAEVFRTITGEDWRRSIARARAEPNRAWEQIRQKILDSGLGKSGSGTAGILTKDNTDFTDKKHDCFQETLGARALKRGD